MLIKSECQALDKTRHKPAWNLFEQRESCKMAGEICSAACPLNSARSPVSVTSITLYNKPRETARRADGRDGIRRGPPLLLALWLTSAR